MRFFWEVGFVFGKISKKLSGVDVAVVVVVVVVVVDDVEYRNIHKQTWCVHIFTVLYGSWYWTTRWQ